MSRLHPRFHRVNAPLPVIAPQSVLRLSLQGVSEGNATVTVLDYLSSAVPPLTASYEAAFATSFLAAIMSSFQALVTSTWSAVSVRVADVTRPTRAPSINLFPATTVVGAQPFPALPSTDAVVISKITAVKGQHGRGRIFMPNVPVAFTLQPFQPEFLTPTALAGYIAFGNLLLNPIISSGITWDLCVSTRSVGAAPVTNAAIVASMIVRTLLGTVRRRRLGRGI